MRSVVFPVCSGGGFGCSRVISSGEPTVRKAAARRSSASSGSSPVVVLVVV